MTAPTPDGFDSPDGHTHSAPETTPGQLACIAWNAHYAEEHGIEARNEWAASDSRGRAAWEAAAQAGHLAIAAAAPAGQAAPGERELDDLREKLTVIDQENASLRVLLIDTFALVSVLADGKPHAQHQANALRKRAGFELQPVPAEPQAQPAPELAAAMAETRNVRAVLASVLSWFGDNQSGRYARVSGHILARAYQDGGIPLPDDLRRHA